MRITVGETYRWEKTPRVYKKCEANKKHGVNVLATKKFDMRVGQEATTTG